MYYESFLLGPLEAMRPLPAPFARLGVANTLERFGGLRESISGKGSLAVFGFKREWVFSYPLLSSRQTGYLRAFWKWSQPRALRLSDPFFINLISADASLGGGESRTIRAVTVSAGTVSRVDITTALNPFLTTFLDSAYSWSVPTTTAGIMLFDDTIKKHIVLRDLRQRVLTMEVTGSGTVQALVRPYNAAGIAQADVLGTAVVLSAAWQPVTVVYIPSAADVSCKAGLSISSAAGVRIPVVTAAKFRDSNDRAEWSIGEGLGEVLVSSFTTQYRSLGNYNVGFSVREV